MNDRAHVIQSELIRVDGRFGGAKHYKMAANPFNFMRGSAQLFYHDLASGLLSLPEQILEVPLTTVMGDCHISNFGFFTEEGSHCDRVIFAPNDFDDACVGHAAWDLVRFCASLLLCQDYCAGLQITAPVVTATDVQTAMKDFFMAYRETCATDTTTTLARLQVVGGFTPGSVLYKARSKARSRAAGGADFMRKSTLAKWVDLKCRPLKFSAREDKFREMAPEAKAAVEEAFAPYTGAPVLDIVERVNAGTGSVNLQRYYLLVGPTANPDDEQLPLCQIVEVKQQREAAPLHFFPDLALTNRLNPAHLTLYCQRRMERVTDWVLDEVVWQGKHWLIRSRHHARVGFDPEDIAVGHDAVSGGFVEYAQSCGRALAMAHCRGDRRSSHFERAVWDTLPQAQQRLEDCAVAYAHCAMEDAKLLGQLLAPND